MKYHSFLSILQAEHYKSKRNQAILLILIFPIAVSVFSSLYQIYKLYQDNNEVIHPLNPWISIVGIIIIPLFSFLYPFLIAILCYSLCENEYKNDNYKQLLTLPVSTIKIYTAKIVYLVEIILLTILIAYTSFLLSECLLAYLYPQLPFQDYDMQNVIFTYFIKLFISLLAIGLVQYCLSLTFKNFIIPIGINCFMSIFAMLFTTKWEYYYLIIYNSSYRTYTLFNEEISELGKSEYWNGIYIFLFSIIGYLIFKQKK